MFCYCLLIGGLGSEAHWLTNCFTVGFYTNRTVIVQSNVSRYSKDSWESFMLPISETCTTIDMNQTVVTVSSKQFVFFYLKFLLK